MALSRNPEFPLDPTFKINGDGSITVDQMLKQPTRITRYVVEKVNENLLSEKLYNSTSVSGGILMYNQITSKIGAQTSLRTGIVAPGGEFPEIDQTMVTEEFTTVQKVGGKISITDEARKRNDERFLKQQLDLLSRRMITDLNQDAVDAFEIGVAPFADEVTIESNGWAKVNKTKAADKTALDSIEADLGRLQLHVDGIDLGYNYSTLLLHPEDYFQLGLAVGVNQQQNFLSQWGWTIERSKHVPKGTAWLLAPKQVGTIGVESPIASESWRDEAHQTTHNQTWATVGHAITDPYALVKITGLDKES